MATSVTSHFAPEPVGQLLRAGQHQVLSDVTHAQGGSDGGMDPHELVAAALAACTGMTLRLYASRKQWPLTDVKVQVNIAHEGPQTAIVRHIELVGDLDPTQRQRLVEIANKCPIHGLLTSSVHIMTEASEPPAP